MLYYSGFRIQNERHSKVGKLLEAYSQAILTSEQLLFLVTLLLPPCAPSGKLTNNGEEKRCLWFAESEFIG